MTEVQRKAPTRKKEQPAQVENRRWWILETIRENQSVASAVIQAASEEDWATARIMLGSLYGTDRDALMQSGGVLTDLQIARIKGLT